jgi:hypothetical protein
MRSVLRKLYWLTRRTRKDDELQAELQFHLDEEADERAADGVPIDEARRAARIDLGNLTVVREDTRAQWTWRFLEPFVHRSQPSVTSWHEPIRACRWRA